MANNPVPEGQATPQENKMGTMPVGRLLATMGLPMACLLYTSAAHAHEVAGLVRREGGADGLEHLVHHRLGLAHAEAADAVAGQIALGHLLGAGQAELGVERALDDAEQGLVGAALGGDAAVQPAQGTLHGPAGLVGGAGPGGALVELHDDIGAQFFLDGHRGFGGEKVGGAVQVGAEGDLSLIHI